MAQWEHASILRDATGCNVTNVSTAYEVTASSGRVVCVYEHCGFACTTVGGKDI